jgi:alpha-aminoadipate carrier protein LysW
MTSEVTIGAAECPECAALLAVPRGTVAGEILPCGECLAELEVTLLEPLTLALAPEVEEDWGE